MSKPWLETWRIAGKVGLLIKDVDGDIHMGPKFGVERTRVAAAAPMLVRALLAAEWQMVWIGGMHQACPECLGVQPSTGGNGHSSCDVDAALTAAGLPDQASRDEARRKIAESGL